MKAVVYGFDRVLLDNRTNRPISVMIDVAKQFAQAGYKNIIISSRPKQLYYNFVTSFLNRYNVPYHKLVMKDIRDKREKWEFMFSVVWALAQEYQISLVYEFDLYTRRVLKERLGINTLLPEHLLVH